VHPADAGDDPGGRDRTAVLGVEAVRGERGEFEEGGARIEQPVDAIARQQLAACRVLRPGALIAAQPDSGQVRAQLLGKAA